MLKKHRSGGLYACAHVTRLVIQELLRQVEYLAAENRIVRRPGSTFEKDRRKRRDVVLCITLWLTVFTALATKTPLVWASHLYSGNRKATFHVIA